MLTKDEDSNVCQMLSEHKFAIPAEEFKNSHTKSSKKISKKSKRKTPHISFDYKSNETELQKNYYFCQTNMYKQFCSSTNDFYQDLISRMLDGFNSRFSKENHIDQKTINKIEISNMPKIVED